VLAGLAGCEKPPTWSELVNGKKEDEKPATVATPTPSASKPIAFPTEPARPKKTPQETITQFRSKPTEQRNDQDLVELAGIGEGLDQFTGIDLTHSAVTEKGIAVLPKFDHLETLVLDGCQLTNAGLEQVSKIKSLVSLSMDGGAIRDPNTDAGLAHIKNMQQLTSLHMDRAKFSPQGIANVAKMTWLESFSAAETLFNEQDLEQLAELTNLKDLNVSRTRIGDAGFRGFLPFKELVSLNISQLRGGFTGQGLKDLVQAHGIPKLRSLNIYGNRKLQTPAYEAIYKLPTLETLDLSEVDLDDAHFTAVKRLTKLERLSLSHNSDLTTRDSTLQTFLSLKKLKRVSFENNPGINDRIFQSLSKLKNLEVVVLWDTHVTEQGAQAFKRKLPNCEVNFNRRKLE
jgi:Leucine-rich repeat (LRR) protein